MALVGLWHGAGWGFVIWGLLHGSYLVLYRIWENSFVTRFPALAESRIVGFGWRVFTIAAVMAAWIPFRASTGTQTLHMLKSMLTPTTFGVSYSVNFYLLTLMAALFCILEPYIGTAITRAESWTSERGRLYPVSRYALWPLVYAVGLFLFAVFDDRNQQFIYFQF
jgi:D-alanyl-lipoteichoic acid acyltransferase DltB (MBOAT superfamily)